MMNSKKGSNSVPAIDAEKSTKEYDPFASRNIEHPTTDRETLVHLMKASLGTGILAMPYVFKLGGLATGFFIALVTSFICAHCSYILVKCAHILYKRTRTSSMTFAEIAEAAFVNGPNAVHGLAPFARHFVTILMFATYFGACAVYAVIIGENTKQMYAYYTSTEEENVSLRICILIFLIPLVLFSSIRNLKFLAPVSMLANICMAIGLSITIYYFLSDLPDLAKRPMVGEISAFPSSIAITIFAIEAIGVVMPLENQMKTPQNYVGVFGVLNKGMAIVTAVYLVVGFLGFWCFGRITMENITRNLPVNEKKAQVVKIAVLLSVLMTFSLQLYVCIEIVFNAVKDRVGNKQVMTNYVIRVLLSTSAVLLAVAVPTMGPLIELVGAFGFSCFGLILPVIIEIMTCWNYGFGRFNWILIKNFICVVFGLFALIFGTRSAIAQIFQHFS
ncbi:proton-coupled amino acid transporter-like protein pathetic [Contarinia nasturtii]|uniref:proton-coupled amino acid transporter-like protein pathetic n=1 Tax=Contarinia nasturtii TaxID=265458 RepID=UPI0012D432E6|nr:proton-coupled amino acid transporter-like protein pathetic [Contarinia nasturtii]